MKMSRWTSLDKVLEIEPGKSGRALRNVPNTLSILDSHFPRFPVMPGVLILGSMGELAALVLREQTGQAWRLSRAERVRFAQFVRPGDQMELTVEAKDISEQEATFSASAKVDGKAVTTVRVLRLVPTTPAGAL
jgi:3-hydroxyacyl-[acyl-carrier-protein] dehydratase